MAKKVRRIRRRAPKQKAVEPAAQTSISDEISERPPVINEKRSSDVELEQEYAYVMQDLRRVFILAAILFVLLIVLNIILG